MHSPSLPQVIALSAATLHGLLALTLWLLLRRRQPSVVLSLWLAGVLATGVALAVPGLQTLLDARPGPGPVFLCLLGGLLLRVLALRQELGWPQQPALTLGAWLLAGAIDQAATWLPWPALRPWPAAALLVLAATVFARHAVAVGRTLGSRIGHGLAAAELLTALAIVVRGAMAVLHGTPAPDLQQPGDLTAMGTLAIVTALFGNLGYLGLVLVRSRSAEQAASATQRAERLRREAAEDRAASLRGLLQQRDALANERDQLLKLLAHEIRQPLHNASGALQAARSVLAEPGSDQRARATERLRRAQGVLTEVRSVLDNTLAAAHLLGRVDALYMPDTPLMPLLQQALADLPDAQRRLVRVQWQDLPDSAELEAGLVRLALRNLLRNAFRHGGPAVSVLLQCERQAQPPALVVSVTDDGVGPPPDWQLEPPPGLLQAAGNDDDDDATGAQGSGDAGHDDAADGAGTPPRHPASPARGLGLTIVRDVMARHGGRLVLQPRHPHGLVVRLEFPQRARMAAA